MKGTKKFIAAVLLIVMALGLFSNAYATQTNLPLKYMNNLVVDGNTKYITHISQDPTTKMITARVQIENDNKSDEDLIISLIGFELSFTHKVAPYNKANSSKYAGATKIGTGVLDGYCSFPTGINLLSPEVMSNDSESRMIGGKITATDDNAVVKIKAGKTADIAEFYFMPTNENDVLEPSWFSFNYKTVGFFKLGTAIAFGTSYMVSNKEYASMLDDYAISPSSFKMHVKLPAPTNLSANEEDRTVNHYDQSTMEWSTDEDGDYSKGEIAINDEKVSVFVRMQGKDYYETSDEYVNYKKNLPSDPVEIEFDGVFYSAKEKVSLAKTSENITTEDGKTHVGDTIEYTVTAKNDGHIKSVWADAVMTDVLPEGLTFVADSVMVNNAAAGDAASFNEATRTLTVDLGDIYGETERVITFQAEVNEDAYGKTIINSAKVEGKDGENGEDLDKEVTEDGGHTVVDISESPVIDPITEGDDKVTGTGIAGSEIVVTFPDKSTETTTVEDDGTWEVDAPPTLKNGDEVKAVQTEPDKDTSKPTTEVVGGRPAADLSIEKDYENTTSEDGKNHVNDIIEYTILVENSGDKKSLVIGAVVTDELPEGVTYVEGSVNIDDEDATAEFKDGTLTVTLGDIPGGEIRTITFQVQIDGDAYGKTIKNSATVAAKDGGDDKDIEDEDDDDNTDPVCEQSEMPEIDEIYAGDRVVTGTGIAGADITVILPGGAKVDTTVDDEGKWSINVPAGMDLKAGDIVQAIQTEQDKDPSDPASETVKSKPAVVPELSKTSRNLTSTDGKTHVGDKIEYTITVKNAGPVKSLWVGVVATDPIPENTTFVSGSIKLNGTAVGDYFESDDKIIVSLGDIAGGITKTVTFEVTVNSDAYGETIKNAAVIDGKDDGSGGDIEEEITDGDGQTVLDKSEAPTINDVVRGDETISGEGIPGSEIIVTLPDGTKLSTTVEDDDTWTVDVPNNKELNEGDEIVAIQIEVDKDPSDEVTTIVKDKSYRAVTGLVEPFAGNDQGNGNEFLEEHEIVVELRETFNTQAPAELRTIAVKTTVDGQGRFTIENVPFGTYVLYIDRAGYLVRSMTVTIGASDPDMIELTPPDDEKVFVLWAGDINRDMVADASDIAYIVGNKNAAYNNRLYFAPCDVNADGIIDAEDINLVKENLNKTVADYAGAENIDFYA